MKGYVLCVGIGLMVGGILASSAVVSGDQEGQPEMSAEHAAVMAEWTKIATPGEGHKHLEYFVGKWKTKSSMYMGGPGTPPMVSDGTSDVKWVLDGRFVMDTHHGSMMGQPYHGIGMTGYDNYRNMYESTWTSNMGTNMLTMKGARHPETGVFTFYGEMDEPALKVIGRTVKYVTKIVDKDHYTFDIIDAHVSEDYKVISIAYERVK